MDLLTYRGEREELKRQLDSKDEFFRAELAKLKQRKRKGRQENGAPSTLACINDEEDAEEKKIEKKKSDGR